MKTYEIKYLANRLSLAKKYEMAGMGDTKMVTPKMVSTTKIRRLRSLDGSDFGLNFV